MFEIFLKRNVTYEYPIKKYSKFDYIKRRYMYQYDYIKQYYSNREYSVINTNLISRLILTLAPSIELDVYDYLTQVSSSARLVSKQFDIVSNINYGRVLEDVFFGKNSREVFLYREDYIDIDNIKNNWKNLQTIRVLYTEETNLDFPIPYFSYTNINSIDERLYIMSIDIITLMLQYRYWCLERMSTNSSIEPTYFVAKVVIPNMIGNMLDIAIYNRFIKISNSNNIHNKRIQHPFNVIDYSITIDKILKSIVRDFKDTHSLLEQMYASIPGIFNDNILQALYIDHRYYTVQSEWVLWLSRISVLKDSFKILGTNGIKRNTDIIHKLMFTSKQFIRSRTIDRRLDNSPMIAADFYMDFEKLNNMIKGIT